MAVLLETTAGDIVIDLYPEERPKCCLNFLKLCKMKYYNFNIFHSVQSNFMAQSGDPTGTGNGGESVFCKLKGDDARFFDMELHPRIKHKKKGCMSMVNNGSNQHGSQFFITLREDIDYLDGIHSVFGEVTEGFDVLDKISETFCDGNHRPLQDIRINHTVILDDPFDDPEGLEYPDRSPEIDPYKIKSDRIAADEDIEEEKNKTTEQVEKETQEQETRAKAQILEMIGDLPDADVKPPENVLFVCKLNPVTTSEDLQIIFSRFGKMASCEVIKDQATGDSLCYAFVEFEKEEDCEEAYFKMDNVLIDDRRIHVDFSQSVAKLQSKGRGPVMPQRSGNKPRGQNSRYDRGDVTSNREKNSREKDKRSRENDSPPGHPGRSTYSKRQYDVDRGSRDGGEKNRKRRDSPSPHRSREGSNKGGSRADDGLRRRESLSHSPEPALSRKRNEREDRSDDRSRERKGEGGRAKGQTPSVSPERPHHMNSRRDRSGDRSKVRKTVRESSKSPSSSPERVFSKKSRSGDRSHDKHERRKGRSSSKSTSPPPRRRGNIQSGGTSHGRSGDRSHDKSERRKDRSSSRSTSPHSMRNDTSGGRSGDRSHDKPGERKGRSRSKSASPSPKRDKHERKRNRSESPSPSPERTMLPKKNKNGMSANMRGKGNQRMYDGKDKNRRDTPPSPSSDRSRKREVWDRSGERKRKGRASSESASPSPDRSSSHKRDRKDRSKDPSLDKRKSSSGKKSGGRKHQASSSESSEGESSEDGKKKRGKKCKKSHKTSKKVKKER